MNKKLLIAKPATKKNAHFSTHKEDNGDLSFYIDVAKLNSRDLYFSVMETLKNATDDFEVDFHSFSQTAGQDYSDESIATVLAAAIEMSNKKSAFSMKSEKPKTKKSKLKINDKKLLKEVTVLAEAQTFTRKLQDMPSNILNPKTFVKEIEDQFASLLESGKVKIKVLKNADLLKKKMGLICGVAQASNHGAHIVTIEYNTQPNSPKLGLVGKGVCFDSGGYNVKIGTHMRNMKFDMSGAAAVAGAIYAMAQNDIKTNVVGVLGLVENLIDTNSYRVDDVLTSYSGKTVEIDNTDAEGRLVLADCLTYAIRDLKADKVLTIATLTGAIIYALGMTYAGGWSSYDQDWDLLRMCACKAGEGLWRMPFHNDYLKLLNSEIADIKNSVSSPFAGSSRAACFLKEFSENKPYYHIDIAGMDSFANGIATGPFVRTLYFLGKYNSKK